MSVLSHGTQLRNFEPSSLFPFLPPSPQLQRVVVIGKHRNIEGKSARCLELLNITNKLWILKNDKGVGGADN